MFSSELICRNCGWRTVCGREDAIGRLRLIGLLRRDPDPDEDLLRVLFVEAAPRMTCPICKEKRLHAVDHDADDEDDDATGKRPCSAKSAASRFRQNESKPCPA